MTADRRAALVNGEPCACGHDRPDDVCLHHAKAADRCAAEEALAEYAAKGGKPLEQVKQELERRAALVEKSAAAFIEALDGNSWSAVPPAAQARIRTQITAPISLIRNEALEEAARLCDDNAAAWTKIYDDQSAVACEEAAAAIRALKGPVDPPPAA